MTDTVAVIDHGDTTREKAKRACELAAGHEFVGEAEDSYAGTELIAEEFPDVVVVGVMRDGEDANAFQLVTQLQNADQVPQFRPLLIASEDPNMEIMKLAIKGGFDGLLARPVEPEEIERALTGEEVE